MALLMYSNLLTFRSLHSVVTDPGLLGSSYQNEDNLAPPSVTRSVDAEEYESRQKNRNARRRRRRFRNARRTHSESDLRRMRRLVLFRLKIVCS